MNKRLTIPTAPRLRFNPAHTALVVIDMQRDFVEPGGFGEARQRRDPAAGIIPAVRAMLDAWRAVGGTVAAHARRMRPTRPDCPPAKRNCAATSCASATPGPHGPHPGGRQAGAEIVPELAPLPGELVVDKPGKGMALRHAGGRAAARAWHHPPALHGRDDRGLRADPMREAMTGATECLIVGDGTESYFPSYKVAALSMLTAQGAIVGWSATTAEIQQALPD